MKLFKTIAVTVVLIAGLGFGVSQLTKNSNSEFAGIVDQLNPFLKTSTVYVKINEPAYIEEHGNAQYEQTAVDAQGNTRPVSYTGMGVLKKDHYLALTNKGAHVESYAEVQPNEIPTKALNVLKTQN